MDTWYIYILKCNDSTLYTGITNNLNKRIKDHNAGLASKYTRGRLPAVLTFSQKVANRSEALKLEYAVKKLSRIKKLLIINKKIDIQKQL